MKYTCVFKCQVDGKIYRPCDEIDGTGVKPDALRNFRAAPEFILPADEKSVKKAAAATAGGMSVEQYKLVLDGMNIRYKKDATALDLHALYVEANTPPA